MVDIFSLTISVERNWKVLLTHKVVIVIKLSKIRPLSTTESKKKKKKSVCDKKSFDSLQNHLNSSLQIQRT